MTNSQRLLYVQVHDSEAQWSNYSHVYHGLWTYTVEMVFSDIVTTTGMSALVHFCVQERLYIKSSCYLVLSVTILALHQAGCT